MKLFHAIRRFVATTAIVPLILTGAGCAGEGGGLDPNISSALGSVTGGRIGTRERQLMGAGAKMGEAMTLSDRDAAEIGEAIAVAVSENYGIVRDRKLNAYVNKVGLTIAAVCERQDLNFTFGVLDTDPPNALSMPGGYVFVTRGALAQFQDESELAGVLAHEIAHVCKNHGKQAIQRAKTLEAAGDAAKAERPGFVGDFIADGLKEAEKPMGQGEETAADVAAVGYLKAAGYDPRGYLRYLERSQVGGSGGLLATHPSNAARVAKVRQAIGTTSGGATLASRFAANTSSIRKP